MKKLIVVIGVFLSGVIFGQTVEQSGKIGYSRIPASPVNGGNSILNSPAVIFDHDVGVAPLLGARQYNTGYSYSSSANIVNYGKKPETFTVECSISDYLGNVVFTDSKTLNNVSAGVTIFVVFKSFDLKQNNSFYKEEIKTLLAGDMDSSNNSKSRYINTYTSSRDMVLMEIGTGTWCTFCPGASMGAEDLLKNGQNVGVVEYHISDIYETVESRQKFDFYKMMYIPTANFDGTRSFVGGSHTASMYSSYLPIYNAQYSVKTPLSISVFGSSPDKDKYNLLVEVNRLAPIADANCRLLVAVTESDIAYTWEDQKTINFAERLLLPDLNGAKIDIAGRSRQTIPLTFNVKKGWNVSNLELVAWVQDTSSKEVFNCTKIKLNDLKPAVSGVTLEAQNTVKADTLGKEIVFDIVLKNLSDSSRTCFLVRKKNNLPLNWTSSLCFGTTCFASFIDSVATTPEFSSTPLKPGESRDVSVHVITGKNSGTANISLQVGTLSSPNERITLDLTASTVVTSVQKPDTKITKFDVLQNYPNPFNPSTLISYRLPFTSIVKITVYNSLGQEIRILENGIKASGQQELLFNSAGLSSGLYFYTVEAVSVENHQVFRETKKMVVAK